MLHNIATMPFRPIGQTKERSRYWCRIYIENSWIRRSHQIMKLRKNNSRVDSV